MGLFRKSIPAQNQARAGKKGRRLALGAAAAGSMAIAATAVLQKRAEVAKLHETMAAVREESAAKNKLWIRRHFGGLQMGFVDALSKASPERLHSLNPNTIKSLHNFIYNSGMFNAATNIFQVRDNPQISTIMCLNIVRARLEHGPAWMQKYYSNQLASAGISVANIANKRGAYDRRPLPANNPIGQFATAVENARREQVKKSRAWQVDYERDQESLSRVPAVSNWWDSVTMDLPALNSYMRSLTKKERVGLMKAIDSMGPLQFDVENWDALLGRYQK